MELPFDEHGNPRILPPDTRVLTNHDEYRSAARDPRLTSFVRSIFLGYNPPRNLNLNQLLELADTERHRLAKMCGAVLIEVEFAFISSNTEDDIQFVDGELIPRGLRLVGKVPIVRNFICFDNEGFDTNHPLYVQTREGITQYRSEQTSGQYYAVESARMDQFGIIDDSTVILIDADPVLSIK